MQSTLVAFLDQSWNDLDLAVSGLSTDEMETPIDGGSSFGWTVGHVTNMVDSFFNARFQRLSPHPLISQQQFRIGASGSIESWPAVEQAVREVREAAWSYLQDKTEQDLDLVVPYDGSIQYLRPYGLSLRYAILRTAAHHYLHLGEIAAKRDHRGDRVTDDPRMMSSTGWV